MIIGAVYAGPGNKPEGIEALKKEVAGLSKDADIVLYCGCCPMEKCPGDEEDHCLLRLPRRTCEALRPEEAEVRDGGSSSLPIRQGKEREAKSRVTPKIECSFPGNGPNRQCSGPLSWLDSPEVHPPLGNPTERPVTVPNDLGKPPTSAYVFIVAL